MSRFTRPTFNVDDDDLERLQQEFFANEQTPAAKVIRKSTPPSLDPPKQKKRSLFAERQAKKNQQDSMPASVVENMPPLDNMPSLEDAPVVENMPVLEDQEEGVTYEPVMDPHPEPHVPVSKKMLDLTSLLGQVLGEIKEHDVSEDSVKAPTLATVSDNKPARGQHNGFPKPVHRSEFKKRLEAKRLQQTPTKRLETPPTVSSAEIYEDENDRRIAAMSEQELNEAREEIMNTLSPESIALLMKGLKNKTPREKKVTFSEETKEPENDDLFKMKEQFFPQVPLENEKLAWMDNRFSTPQEKEPKEEGVVTEAEKAYRQVRFDLQGRLIDPKADIPFHKGLHHHGDEPEKAGYTLAELFYLSRSQVPSQRAMVLTTLARVIQRAKKNIESPWKHIWTALTDKEHAAVIYLRSALDDRNLVVLVSAIHALSALLLDETEEEFEASVIRSTEEFNQFLGHIAQPVLPQGVQQFERKGLNEKLSELVDRVRQGQTEQEQRDDAELAEKDLVRGLIKMNFLPRVRYLLTTSELLESDPGSVERLVRMLVRMAQAGKDVCELVEEEELLEPIVDWGLVKTEWPMIHGHNGPSLASVQLLTVLAQGSKQLAESIVEKATVTLRFLVTSPTIHELKHRAYALQLETLKLIRVLACYGYIVPTLEDLQEPVMGWLRAVLNEESEYNVLRATTAIGLLEILLYVAADPHKSIPAHAIDWHQPTAYLPAITAVLRTNASQHALYDTCLGYLSAWAYHIRLFPPEPELIREVWKAVVSTVGICDTTHRLVRYVQFLVAYQESLRDTYPDIDVHTKLASLEGAFVDNETKDLKLRYAFWLWLTHSKDKTYDMLALEYGIESRQRGVVEAWLAQNLLHICLSTKAKGLESFYFDDSNVEISKALFHCDGRPIETLMYAISEEELDVGGFLLSPIDAFYHLDKSRLAQKSRLDAVEVVEKSLTLGQEVLKNNIDRDIMVVTLMKVFMIGDREGRQVEMESNEREIFWNEDVSKKIDEYLEVICKEGIELKRLEEAWRRSSGYIRQAQVPFFQFYQGFVAQYASVSFGHHGFARLLVYLVTQIDTVDYRHLLFSDYRELLPTLNKVGVNQVPPVDDWATLEKAGLKLSK